VDKETITAQELKKLAVDELGVDAKELMITEVLGDVYKLNKEVKNLAFIVHEDAVSVRKWLAEASDEYKKQVEDFANKEADRIENEIKHEAKVSTEMFKREAATTTEELKKEVQRVVSSLPLNQSTISIVILCLVCSIIGGLFSAIAINYLNSSNIEQEKVIDSPQQKIKK
jgi:hypothetical protein